MPAAPTTSCLVLILTCEIIDINIKDYEFETEVYSTEILLDHIY